MDVSLPTIFVISVLALMSPGPAVLVIVGTALGQGRARALGVAMGVMTGSLLWSAAAAFGLGAIMLAHAWAFEAVRIAGGAYLLFLAYRSARSALRRGELRPSTVMVSSLRAAYLRGLAVHLTNPKPSAVLRLPVRARRAARRAGHDPARGHGDGRRSIVHRVLRLRARLLAPRPSLPSTPALAAGSRGRSRSSSPRLGCAC